MTTLLITPKVENKTARFKGTIAAGEHVAVTIKDGADWSAEGLTLRVIDLTTHRTLAVFPRPEETLEEGETPDAWDTNAGDLTCTLNLNTTRMVAAARHMIRVPVMFVLGNSSEDERTLYFRDCYEVELWPERIGDDTPYDLDKWPRQIDEWTELVSGFGETLDRHILDNVRHITASERAAWNGKVSPSTLAAYVNAAAYDTVTKKILLKNGNSIVSEIDASDFVKDGMVSSVAVVGENLVITFNTDAGKSPISIPLSDFAVQQVQSDWNQQDPSKKDFIKNKPTIPAPVDISGKADAANLPYALVVPGSDWRFSGAGVQPGVTYTVKQDSTERAVFSLYADGVYAETVDISDDPDMQASLYFSGAQITATRTPPGHLADRAVNVVTVSETMMLTLPVENPGRVRDFVVDMTVAGSHAVSFVLPGGTAPAWVGAQPPSQFAAGRHVISISELSGGFSYAEGVLDPSTFESASNKVQSVSPSSTADEYPSAACVYALVGDVEAALAAINGGVAP